MLVACPAGGGITLSRRQHPITKRSTNQTHICQNYTHLSPNGRFNLPQQLTSQESPALVQKIRQWATELGFQQLGITDVDLGEHEAYLQKWLDAGYHGSMDYMARHGSKRSRPEELVPGTCAYYPCAWTTWHRARKPTGGAGLTGKSLYLPLRPGPGLPQTDSQAPGPAGKRIEEEAGGGEYRAFVDSAPVLERAVAEQAGWAGSPKTPC